MAPVGGGRVLRRARQCAPSEVGAFLLATVTAVDRATARAIMEQLTEAEFDALMGPDLTRFLPTLPDSELEALARGDPVATRRLQRLLRSGQHRGEDCA